MKVNQYEVWKADMNPQVGTEVGKTNTGLERPAFTKSNALSDAILDTREGNGNSFSGSVFAEIRF